MHVFIINIFLVLVLREVETWGAGPKYPASCPPRCNVGLCGGAQRCKRTVLDDCNCCPVCAAARGEHCYRTVSGMHGVKCGPGLFCEFYKEEDDYGDEYGICKGISYDLTELLYRHLCQCCFFSSTSIVNIANLSMIQRLQHNPKHVWYIAKYT